MKNFVETSKTNLIILTGPTGSGKSSLSIDIAREFNGEIINSDSVQIYKEIPKLSFTPDLNNQYVGLIKHHLYGFINCNTYFSVFDFLLYAKKSIKEIIERGKTPILVGGSPMYQRIMIDGISYLNTDKNKQNHILAKELIKKNGLQAFFNQLILQDPTIASRINSKDEYRIIKAFEVLNSGAKIGNLSTLPKIRILKDYNVIKLCLLPEKNSVLENCMTRLKNSNKNDMIEEAKTVINYNLPPEYPAKKAIGIREIEQFLNGNKSFEEAFEEMLKNTHKYVKRQFTWFRNKYSDFIMLNNYSERKSKNAKNILEEAKNIIKQSIN